MKSAVPTQNRAFARRAAARQNRRPPSLPARPARPDPYTLYLEQHLDDLLGVLRAANDGDLGVRMAQTPGDELRNELARSANDLVARGHSISREVIRICTVLGREGRVADRTSLRGMGGEWAACLESLNSIIGDVSWRTEEVANIINGVAEGNFSHKMSLEFGGHPLQGDALRVATAVNQLVDRLRAVSSEVSRVAREVGTEGKLGGQADVRGVSGTWKDLTDNVNLLAGNLTTQVRNIALVTTAVANGDLSQKITVEARGEILALKNTVNTMVEQLRAFAAEVTRVAKEVGTEGKLGGQAEVKGISGTWKDLTDNVNFMASNLTGQVRGIIKVVTAVANGDLSQKFVVEAKGEIAALADTINNMTDTLRLFAQQVITVAREVGIEGKLGGQAKVPGVAGTWRDLTENVNMLAGNLTNQVRNIALVTTAVATGDLSQKITVDARGEILELKNTINTMVDQLRAFAAEVTRVAREVGTEGKLAGQADVKGVSGTWKDLTDNVNLMALNLTNQVRGIVKVVTAVANGDLSQKFVVEAKGEIAALADTINNMTDTLRLFAQQVTTVAREVGIEGKLGGQARVPGAAGTWRDLTDNVNMLAGNLTSQVRNIAVVTTALAAGDLSQKITVDANGEILELKNTINATVDQLRTFAREVTRVAREVGTEGKLGGQAKVPGVAGTWQDLTENVNLMASNLTDQVRGIVKVVTAVAEGDLSQKLRVEAKGEIAALAETINNMTATLRVFADQVTTVAREVGIEGKLGGQARVPGAAGTWRDLTDNVNMLAGNLTSQVRNIALVTTAVANGDLSRKITVDARGEILELKDTINAMVDQLRTFAAEVTRVAREVGTEGKLGGQAQVPGVAGTWKDLTDNVNLMASNLTDQVRGIVKVVTAVASGDLTKKFILEAKGEIAALAETINMTTDTLRTFAEQVTTVAREVGIEGQLGGQAKVPGAAGTWRDLTDNVNQLAGNLTTQVRAISEVASAVTKGDLTRTIDVEAQGEVLSLKDTINQMIANLRDTTQTNKEQNWLKSNLAKFSQIMQGQRSVDSLAQLIMSEVTPLVSAQHGTFFVTESESGRGPTVLRLLSSYAFKQRKNLSNRFAVGEGLVGQCALERKTILVRDVPDDYASVSSSLGEAPPRNIVVLPVLFEGSIKGVIELGSFQEFSPIHVNFLEQLMLSIGVVFNMITASTRTEELLSELKGSNAELEKRTTELEDKASLLEIKNREIAEASANLEEKARQLSRVSKYKSEFLANMSHELRTPLNSLLILAKLLADNEEEKLTPKQVDYAKTIYTSGNDLLSLINQILDLSKIEAGKMSIEKQRLPLEELRFYVERNFSQLGRQRDIAFSVNIAPGAPARITTDPQRLQQILKNLLSNAFKFTEHGEVKMEIGHARGPHRYQSQVLRGAPAVLCFAVSDTGIGIAEEKQQLIFEAFQQADASTSRNYGGTGLGLTISRELARLLGGEIHLVSKPRVGSTFTLYLPLSAEEATESISWAPERAADGLRAERPEGSEAPEPANHEDGLTGRKILLIDDDVRNLFAVTSLLERQKATVLPARGALEGFELLHHHPDIELVLMDIMMPEMDGYEATREIRRTEGTADIPIVALTAKAMPGDCEKCLAAGCNDFVPKPVESERLLSVVRRWLGRRAAEARPAETA
jgi:HAMP domain-containing protein/signal transduction histidine kinase/CheY-like chemotaxis protein